VLASAEEFEGQHPGWPSRLEALRVPAGVVSVRPLRLRDRRSWRRLRLRDQAYLEVWEPSAAGSWSERHTVGAWFSQYSVLRRLARRGQCFPYTITVNGEFAGQLTVGNVIRGSLRSGWLGYWVASSLAGGGVATAAVALVLDHVFSTAGVHRVEATVRPENLASIRVLKKAGFRQEGRLERYLHVDNAWRDHLYFALTVEEIGDGVVTDLIRRGLASGPVNPE